MKKIISLFFFCSCLTSTAQFLSGSSSQPTFTPKVYQPISRDYVSMAATVLQMQEARKASADNAISELYNVIAYYLEQLPDEEEIVTWYTNYTKKIIETANDMYKQECYADAI